MIRIICKPLFCLLLWVVSGKMYGQEEIHLIPQAEKIVYKKGSLSVECLKSISFPNEWKIVGTFLVNDLKEWINLPIVMTDSHSFIKVVKNVDMKVAEMYRLDISKRGIRIEAADQKGMVHAFFTLLQLIEDAEEKRLPLITIEDRPRFGYRGIMLDCSRHFWTIKQLKKHIRQFAFFKLNTLHLHLTDNQGWRLYLEKFPDLAVKGTHYPDFEFLSGCYYHKADLQELVRYAGIYGIEIIPEIDLPGHCLALLAALPHLSCYGGEFEAYPEEQDASFRKRADENMLCIGNPETFRFVEDLITELTEIFPSSFIHLGGDEVSTHIWEQCPKCRKLYQERHMSSWHELQDYFTERVSDIVRSKGKRMIGWDEINDRNAAGINDVVMIWQRDGKEQQRKALERGISVIMSPKDPCYFDFGYARNSTRRLYGWEPVDQSCTDMQIHLIKGGQANLWTEFITTQEEAEKMLFPRICALSETLWNMSEKKRWKDFRERMDRFENILERLKISFFKEKDQDNTGFVPQKEERPRLVCPARVETNMDGIKYYWPEYAFDGDLQTFFATPYSLGKGACFTLILENVQELQKVRIIFDAFKEHLEHIQLSVSEDGSMFRTVSADNKNGEVVASFDTPVTVKSIKMEFTEPLMARLSIKEILLLPQ